MDWPVDLLSSDDDSSSSSLPSCTFGDKSVSVSVGSLILRLGTFGFLSGILTRADGKGRDNKEESLLVDPIGRTNEVQTCELFVARNVIRRNVNRWGDNLMFLL
jgi:hypothetical protein